VRDDLHLLAEDPGHQPPPGQIDSPLGRSVLRFIGITRVTSRSIGQSTVRANETGLPSRAEGEDLLGRTGSRAPELSAILGTRLASERHARTSILATLYGDEDD